jgi:hypothetical protein
MEGDYTIIAKRTCDVMFNTPHLFHACLTT